MNTRLSIAAFAVALLASAPAAAQTAQDSAAIRATALDYIEGWYTGDTARMQRAVHPELAKRIVTTDAQGRSQLSHMGAKTLVDYTREGGGRATPANKRRMDIRILDIYRGAAVVRVDATDWVDYLELARWNGRWVIVNVLWENRPR
ncbi:MAG TPA: nuclear transport factor 2 family protein [Gemmatimonadaceae bacterium]|nr:nuclear transport factor 2 family protein [Gemmatimonadaceae bacterium]